MGPCGPIGPPAQPTPPVFILASLSACLRRLTEVVKSCRRLMSTSKLMTKASSLERSMLSRNDPPTSFSMSRTRCWLPLESIRMPSVSGRSVSALKYLIVCGLPVLEEIEVVLGEAWDQRTMLIFDVEKQLHNFDIDFQRINGLLLCPVIGSGPVTGSGIGVGFRAGRGGRRWRRRCRNTLADRGDREGHYESKCQQGDHYQGEWGRSAQPPAGQDLQCTLSIRVFIPRLC